MRNILKFCTLILVVGWSPGSLAENADTCECPKLSCDKECEIETDLTFYTEKCAAGTKVRSCSRPTCVKIENPPPQCGMAKSESANSMNAPVSAAARAEPQSRDIASVSNEKAVIGRVKFLEGSVEKVLSNSKAESLNIGDSIREEDRIRTSEQGRMQILFNGGNLLNITPNSEVVIAEASDSIPSNDKKRMVLDLIRGRIRNKVNQKYDGKQSYYRVRTGAAVAGVRGTDFVVSLVTDEKNVLAKIETLEGRVELSDKSLEKKAVVAIGETASFVTPKNSPKGDKAEFVNLGFLTPVSKLTRERIDGIEQETDFALVASNKKSQRSRANSEPICSNPLGDLNQCAWTCENNPSGEKTCRTDLPQVSCVRRICNANGLWSQPTRLPSAYHESCAPDRTVVKPCDY